MPGTLAAYIYYLFIKIIHFPPAYLYIYIRHINTRAAALAAAAVAVGVLRRARGQWDVNKYSALIKGPSSIGGLIYILHGIYAHYTYIYISGQ